MTNAKEVYQSIKFYGESETGTNPPKQFFWVLNTIVNHDIEQAKEILGPELESGLLTYASIYAQRVVEMAYIFAEVFVRDEYKNWKPTTDSPRVIDLGGDPGAVSALYWKSRKPNAHVTVVEANPATASTMTENIARKGINGVEIINAAISSTEGIAALTLHKPGEGWHTQDFVGGSKAIFGNINVEDLTFQKERRSGDDVVKINKPVKKYGEYRALDLERAQPVVIRQGEKWLLWGPNGSGKSTLVRMIASEALGGNFSADKGDISIGASVDAEYFAPDYIPVSREGLLIDEVTNRNSKITKGHAVSVLSFFGFNTSAIFQQDVSTLSSGEKKRLVLAQMMLQRPNLLIIDEPTGDYLSEEITNRLANAIKQYDGTLILVSHDQNFIDKLGIHRILDMPSGRVRIV